MARTILVIDQGTAGKDPRTAPFCDELEACAEAACARATKIGWSRDHVVRDRARRGSAGRAAAPRATSEDLGRPGGRLRVDGEGAANDLWIQFSASVTRVSVERPNEVGSTAHGAAMLAGAGAWLLVGGAAAKKMLRIERTFEVRMDAAERERRLMAWQDAVRQARS